MVYLRSTSNIALSRYPEEADMERAYLDQTRHRQIDLIVVSDAEAILGIGGKLMD